MFSRFVFSIFLIFFKTRRTVFLEHSLFFKCDLSGGICFTKKTKKKRKYKSRQKYNDFSFSFKSNSFYNKILMKF